MNSLLEHSFLTGSSSAEKHKCFIKFYFMKLYEVTDSMKTLTYKSGARSTEAIFIVLERGGDKVNSGIGLSYRPASLCSLAGRCDNLMPELTSSPQSGTMNSGTGV